MESYYNFSTVAEAAGPRIEALVNQLFPEARREGSHFRVGSLSGEKGRSVSIAATEPHAGCYQDHADPTIRGNVINLVAEAKNLSYQDAGKWLAEWLGVRPEERFPRRRKKQPVIDKTGIKALNAKSIGYAKSRNIERETLQNFGCASTETHIVFPHYDDENKVVLLKFWSCDGLKNLFSNKEPIHTLFGKPLVNPKMTRGSVLICEGQWDAMSWWQSGIAAVSIPSGVSNEEWIEEDWVWLSQFSEIILNFDNDPEGREALEKARIRLGYERCKVLRLPYKDANEVLKELGQEKGAETLRKAYKDAQDAPVENIVNLDEHRQEIKDELTGVSKRAGTPFFLSALPIEFLPHQSTIWFGYTGQGKSTCIEQQIAFQAARGVKTFLAGFESSSIVTAASLLVQMMADAGIGGNPNFDEALDFIKSRVFQFDSMRRCSPQQLIATMTLAHRQLGVTSFVTDNVMTLEVDRQDNTAQAAVADLYRIFVARYPVHNHVVAHPRKPSEAAGRPPALTEIRGASEWSDMAHNAICVWRDTAKAEKISDMFDQKFEPAEIEAYRQSCPDGKIFVRKQRRNGEMPVCSVNFRKDIKRFWKNPEDLEPYWKPENAR